MKRNISLVLLLLPSTLPRPFSSERDIECLVTRSPRDKETILSTPTFQMSAGKIFRSPDIISLHFSSAVEETTGDFRPSRSAESSFRGQSYNAKQAKTAGPTRPRQSLTWRLLSTMPRIRIIFLNLPTTGRTVFQTVEQAVVGGQLCSWLSQVLVTLPCPLSTFQTNVVLYLTLTSRHCGEGVVLSRIRRGSYWLNVSWYISLVRKIDEHLPQG